MTARAAPFDESISAGAINDVTGSHLKCVSAPDPDRASREAFGNSDFAEAIDAPTPTPALALLQRWQLTGQRTFGARLFAPALYRAGVFGQVGSLSPASSYCFTLMKLRVVHARSSRLRTRPLP